MRSTMPRRLLSMAGLVLAGCTLAPSPSPVPQPVGPGPVIDLVASGVMWNRMRLDMAAGVPNTVVVENRDAGVPHGLEVHAEGGELVYRGEVAVGPASTRYGLPGLVPGAYTFRCPVHPQMAGQIFVR